MQYKFSVLTLLVLLVFAGTFPSVFAQSTVDRDDDEIPDDFDDCPVLPEDYEGIMDDDGCPDLYMAYLDTDRDGISDQVDQCPDAWETHNDFQDEDGCPDVSPADKKGGMVDSDDDGINDRVDNCPNQPETYNRFLDADGCPDTLVSTNDTDRDGVYDTQDLCPNNRETYNKFIDEDGCPDNVVAASPNVTFPDEDDDGVPNWKDQCPADSETYNQFMDDDGCPDQIIPERTYIPGKPDADKDGFTDEEDLCPDFGETWNKYKDGDGCPDVYPRERLISGNHVDEQTEVTLLGEGTDENPEDVLTYLWDQTEGQSVKLSSLTSTKPTFTAPVVPNGETKVLSFLLTVSDGMANDTDSVTVVVDPVNEFPTVDAGPDQTVDEKSEVMLKGTASDPDGDNLTCSWMQIGGPIVSLPSSSGLSITFTAPTIDKETRAMVFELSCSDGYGGRVKDAVKITVEGAGAGPRLIANAGETMTVYELTEVTLDGSDSINPSGKPITFDWTQIVGESVTLSSTTDETTTFIAPEVRNGETKVLTFKLVVTNELDQKAEDVVIVIVKPVNDPPTVNAGDDRKVNKNTIVQLEGSGTDPNPEDKVFFTWKQISGPTVKISNTLIPSPTFIAPNIANGETGSLTFELTGSDRFGGSDKDTVTITVNPVNSAPKANAGSDQTVYEETQVMLAGSGKDVNGDSLSLTWKQTAGPMVSLSSNKVANPTFTAPTILNNSQTLTLLFSLGVSDGTFTDVDTVKVTVLPVNDPPTANAGSDQTVNEGTQGRLAGSGKDINSDPLTFSWTQIDGPTVALSSTTGASPTFNAPDVEGDTRLTFQLVVNDGMTDSAPDTVTFTIREVPLKSLIANAGKDRIVDEQVTVTLDGSGSNDPSGKAIFYSWKQIEGEPVVLSSSTVVSPSFISPAVANGEVKYLVFELTVTDKNGRTATDTVRVTVDPINIDPVAKASVLKQPSPVAKP